MAVVYQLAVFFFGKLSNQSWYRGKIPVYQCFDDIIEETVVVDFQLIRFCEFLKVCYKLLILRWMNRISLG